MIGKIATMIPFFFPQAPQNAPQIMPLAPLTAREMQETTQILRATNTTRTSTRFVEMSLQEPEKTKVLGRVETPREAFVILYDRDKNQTREAIVDITNHRVRTIKTITGVQPALLFEDYGLADSIVKADAGFKAAMARRGIVRMQDLYISCWGAGRYSDVSSNNEDGNKRLIRAVPYLRESRERNAFSRPIEGVVAVVDVNARRVVRLLDTGVSPVPPKDELIGTLERNTAPAGREAGTEVVWKNWRFQWSLHPREGLVLHQIAWQPEEAPTRPTRSILYRASLSEMVVPYANPGPTWYFRNAFDEGEFGIGRMAAPLRRGREVPENAELFDATLSDESGNPVVLGNVVALYERDGGLLYKHYESEFGTVARHGKELVLVSYATLGNYDYGFQWVFKETGEIEVQILLTGIVNVRGKTEADNAEHEGEKTGHDLTPALEGVHHQHFFNFRLDMDVDGTQNSIIESETVATVQGPKNPEGNAFTQKNTILKNESEAKRQPDGARARFWKIENAESNTAYALLPAENVFSLAAPSASFRKRAGFLEYGLWATPYTPEERYAAGSYVNQSAGGEGLPKWVQNNRNLEKKDSVLWYTLGVTHLPRPEEWPLMPVHKVGFRLVPVRFFTQTKK
jgi:primary-amine oxidase